jgi:hypothetical protein
VSLRLLALLVCKETKQKKQTQERTREAHVGMLQQHRRERAQNRYIDCSSAIGLLDRAVWWRRRELGHWLEVAVCHQFPRVIYAGPSLTILEACRDAVGAGAAEACR